MADETKPLSKITVKIWQPILSSFTSKIDAACLRRDSYLNVVLALEIPRLNSEVSIPNSEAALKHVGSMLDRLDRKLVSLSLQSELIEQLDAVCKRKRISRDAFFNRLFLLLSASSKVIDTLLFPDFESWRTEVWSEYKHEGPFFQNTFHPLVPDIDPFLPIRWGIEMYEADSSPPFEYVEPETGETITVKKGLLNVIEPVYALYSALFVLKMTTGEDLSAFNCYMPDHLVPNHPTAIKHQQTLEEMFDLLGANTKEPATSPSTIVRSD